MPRGNFIKPKHVVHRLVNKTLFLEKGCWLWMGSQDYRGYGHIRLAANVAPEKVHRIAAYHFLGYTGEHQVNHKRECVNKHCWNPDHLYIGTQAENNEDTRATVFIRELNHLE